MPAPTPTQLSTVELRPTRETMREAAVLPTRVERARNRLALIDPRPLTRVSVSLVLTPNTRASRRFDDFTLSSFANVEDFESAGEALDEVGLILLNIGPDPVRDESVRIQIDRLRGRCAGTPLAILADRAEPSHAVEALRMGAQGYLPTSLELPVVLHALRLIHAGGVYAPPGLLLRGSCIPKPPSCGALKTSDFTPRQWDVLRLLRQGRSNKEIAVELTMQESTVKVHVRQILKKLQAANRTHAAVLAAQALGDGNVCAELGAIDSATRPDAPG